MHPERAVRPTQRHPAGGLLRIVSCMRVGVRSLPQRARASALALAIGAVGLSAAGCGSTPPSPASLAPTSAAPSVAVVPSPAVLAPSTSPIASTPVVPPAPIGRPLGAPGSIVVETNDGSLVVVDTAGQTVLLASTVDGSYAFPAWSPDGTRIAAIRARPGERSILVFDVAAATVDPTIEPIEILRSGSITPFYLSWRPDGRSVSYLANEAAGLSLRIAPADGSAPIDGSASDATIQTGDPFYFDWIGTDRLLAHIGSGEGAFLGEIGLDGVPTGSGLPKPGDFRSAVVSADGTRVSYVRTTGGVGSEVVVVAPDGLDARAMPVFGSAAVSFDPTSDAVATIGAVDPGQVTPGLPIGPLRLLGASEDVARTLLDGSVVSFWWSPDGSTIAALRVQPAGAEASATPDRSDCSSSMSRPARSDRRPRSCPGDCSSASCSPTSTNTPSAIDCGRPIPVPSCSPSRAPTA